jgi:RND superfamily putative drug exporter
MADTPVPSAVAAPEFYPDMFSSISRRVIRRPGLVVLACIALAAALRLVAPSWDQVTKDDNVRFFPPDFPSVIGQNLLERGFPRDAASSQVVLVCERTGGPLTPGDKAYVDGMAGRFYEFAQGHPELGFKKLDTYRSPVIGPRLLGDGGGEDARAVLSIVALNGTYLAKTTRVAVDRILEWVDQERTRPPGGLELAVTGSAVVGHDINTAANESIANTTWTTVILVVVILLVVYRSPLLAMVPLVTIALSVMVSFWAIALLTTMPHLGFQVINITRVFVVVVLFGAGTDYCLFLIARYSEELGRGRSRSDALREAMSQVGGALVASAGTVIVGLGMLFFSSFAKIKYTGPAIALSLAFALAASLTLAPSLLALLRGAIFWPFRSMRPAGGVGDHKITGELTTTGFWVHAADLVVHYPLAILAVCLAALLPLAVVGARTRSNYNQLADLDRDRPSVIGAAMVRRHFAVGELSPATALVDDPALDFRSDQGRSAIQEISRRLQAVDLVAEVRSLTQPVGKPFTAATEGSFFGRLTGGLTEKALQIGAEARYVSIRPTDPTATNHITRFDIVFKTDPFSEASLEALGRVRQTLEAAAATRQPLEGTRAIGLAGSTAAVSDLRRVTTSDQRRMYVLITLGVYAILVVLLRRPGIGLYLVATVVLGYLASLGLTDLFFHALHRGPEPWGGLDWTVAFFLFVILVAVGEDYNIFLMARVVEEEQKYGVTEGTRRAVAHTGGIISSCGLIMAGTFGAMLTGKLASLRELGFALGIGVLLDTFLVRPILVPAFLVLVDRACARRSGTAEGNHDEALVSQASYGNPGRHHGIKAEET